MGSDGYSAQHVCFFPSTTQKELSTANSNWVQPAEKEAGKVTPQLYPAPVPSSSCCPSSWFQMLPAFQPWPSPICHCWWSCFRQERRPLGWRGTNGSRGIGLFMDSSSFILFCPCFLLAVWGKRSLLVLSHDRGKCRGLWTHFLPCHPFHRATQ